MEAIFFLIQSVAQSFDAKVFLFPARPMKECFSHFSLSPISVRLPLWLCASHVSLLGSFSLHLENRNKLNYFTEVVRV